MRWLPEYQIMRDMTDFDRYRKYGSIVNNQWLINENMNMIIRKKSNE